MNDNTKETPQENPTENPQDKAQRCLDCFAYAHSIKSLIGIATALDFVIRKLPDKEKKWLREMYKKIAEDLRRNEIQ